MEHSSKNEVKNYCKDLFLNDNLEIDRCTRPHIYCKFRCSGLVSTLENIRNHQCYATCVRHVQNEDIAKKKKKHPLPSFNWNPTVGAKCDYKPSGTDLFVACIVRGLSELPNKKFAQIQYLTKDREKRNVHVNYPNSSFLQCGKGITVRNDCDT